MPSIGLLMRMPFHVTCVCEGPVPRNDTVERVARPYCLTKIGELKVSTSAIDRAMFSFRIKGVEPGLLHADAFHRPAAPDRDFADGHDALFRHDAAPVSDRSDCARSSAGNSE